MRAAEREIRPARRDGQTPPHNQSNHATPVSSGAGEESRADSGGDRSAKTTDPARDGRTSLTRALGLKLIARHRSRHGGHDTAPRPGGVVEKELVLDLPSVSGC